MAHGTCLYNGDTGSQISVSLFFLNFSFTMVELTESCVELWHTVLKTRGYTDTEIISRCMQTYRAWHTFRGCHPSQRSRGLAEHQKAPGVKYPMLKDVHTWFVASCLLCIKS